MVLISISRVKLVYFSVKENSVLKKPSDIQYERFIIHSYLTENVFVIFNIRWAFYTLGATCTARCLQLWICLRPHASQLVLIWMLQLERVLPLVPRVAFSEWLKVFTQILIQSQIEINATEVNGHEAGFPIKSRHNYNHTVDRNVRATSIKMIRGIILFQSFAKYFG